jgi:hypothetical protein
MAKLTARQLKMYLKTRERDELVADIMALYTRQEAVRDYYELQVTGSHSDELLNRYKARIKDEFFPKGGYGEAHLSIARKPISEYKKVSDSVIGLADLMLFYVEQGVAFTNAYGDIDAPFYSSMESMFERALKLIKKESLQDQLLDRCQNIVNETRGIGWGFHDELSRLYHEYLERSP